VQPRSLYIDEGNLVTSAGSAAGLDMMLHVIRSDYGSKVANMVAQRLVVAPHRSGGQLQFLPKPVSKDEKGRLASLMDWCRANLAKDHSLDALARRAVMSPRTLQRQFKETTGLSPSEWLISERVNQSKSLLEETFLPLPKIAEKVGFNSLESFRRHFRLIVGTNPSSYRESFGRVS